MRCSSQINRARARQCTLALFPLLLAPLSPAQQPIAPLHATIAATDDQPNRNYCTLTGRVETSTGDPLPDATIHLTAALLPERDAATASDGTFTLAAIAPGTYTVQVTRDGFAPITGQIQLTNAANTATATFTLHPAVTDSATVTASTADIAEAEVKLAEQQRVGGILPNFFVSYMWHAQPLTSGQKFRLTTRNVIDPGNLLLVGTVAGVQQAQNAFKGYGQGAKGYGRRYGAALGDLVSGSYLGGAIFPSLFHQDPRYFYKGAGTTPSRFWYAVTRVAVTRGDNGKPQPNYSTVLGDMSAGAISNLYYAREDRRGAKITIINGLLGIAGDAMNNVFQEFVLKKLTTHSKQNTLP